MRLYGVPPRGQEIELFPGLTIKLPFGVSYAKNQDGSYDFFLFWPTPRAYRNGVFELNNDVPVDWKLTNMRCIFDGQADAAEAVGEYLSNAAAKIQPGGTHEAPVTKGNVTLCIVTEPQTQILIGVMDGSHICCCQAEVSITDAGQRREICQQRICPILYSLRLSAAPTSLRAMGKGPEEWFPAILSRLNFQAGESVNAGEFSVAVPKGLYYTKYFKPTPNSGSPEIAHPEQRLLTCLSEAVSSGMAGEWEHTAIVCTLQTGIRIPTIQNPLNTIAARREAEAVLSRWKAGEGKENPPPEPSKAGRPILTARSPDHYICYELADDTKEDVCFHYYVFSKHFLYPGEYIGKKAGLGDSYLNTHKDILGKFLRGFQYVGGSEEDTACAELEEPVSLQDSPKDVADSKPLVIEPAPCPDEEETLVKEEAPVEDVSTKEDDPPNEDESTFPPPVNQGRIDSLKKEREEAARKAEAETARVRENWTRIQEEKQERVDRITEEKERQEEYIQSLGLFKRSEKAAAKEELARLMEELAYAYQELEAHSGTLEKELRNIRSRYLEKSVKALRSEAYGIVLLAGGTSGEQDFAIRILDFLDFEPKTLDSILEMLHQNYPAKAVDSALLKKVLDIPCIHAERFVVETIDGEGNTSQESRVGFCF